MLLPPSDGFELARIEGDERQPAQNHEYECDEQERRVGCDAPAIAANVVVDSNARAVDPVQERQRQQQEVIDLPERLAPALDDEGVIDLIDRVDDVHDDDVEDGQEQQRYTADAEEVPGEELEATGATGTGSPTAPAQARRHAF